ncbi:hypothetical protein J6590_106422 [Homalodisca vitripennis]|nr:hypothetical protein J6590_106422 [Homalodisca vitripennis]
MNAKCSIMLHGHGTRTEITSASCRDEREVFYNTSWSRNRGQSIRQPAEGMNVKCSIMLHETTSASCGDEREVFYNASWSRNRGQRLRSASCRDEREVFYNTSWSRNRGQSIRQPAEGMNVKCSIMLHGHGTADRDYVNQLQG